jgi:hypothetical protein
MVRGDRSTVRKTMDNVAVLQKTRHKICERVSSAAQSFATRSLVV